MLRSISGIFVKIVFADEVDIVLEKGHAHRPPARFNRPGQDALYLSPNEESARVAIGEYVKAGDPDRVLVTYEVTACELFDLRHPEAEGIYARASKSWRPVLAAGEEPASWGAADDIRQQGHAGLIDPSRRRPGLWHITLLRWNEVGAPEVRLLGKPRPIELALDYR
ncbi:MAG: RES family NAD+ phosphorylase [Sneathiella sp.]